MHHLSKPILVWFKLNENNQTCPEDGIDQVFTFGNTLGSVFAYLNMGEWGPDNKFLSAYLNSFTKD